MDAPLARGYRRDRGRASSVAGGRVGWRCVARARRRGRRSDRGRAPGNGRRIRPGSTPCRQRAMTAPIPFIGAFESTYQPAFDTDVFETTGHDLRWREGFLTVARNVLPSLTEASRLLRELLPDARHVYVEACERHTSSSPEGARYAEWTNDRRFLLTDLFVGRELDPRRPFVADVLACGGADLLEVEPGVIDVLGLDYYAHNQWEWADTDVGT